MFMRFLRACVLVVFLIGTFAGQGSAQAQVQFQYVGAASNFFQYIPTPLAIAQLNMEVLQGNTPIGVGTFLSLSLFTFSNGTANGLAGCWRIPGSDFTVSVSDATAILRTTIVPYGPDANPICPFAPGFADPAFSAPALDSSVQPFPSVTLNLAWMGNGQSSTFTVSSTESCPAENSNGGSTPSYQLEFQTTSTIVNAPAIGTISGFTGTVSSWYNHVVGESDRQVQYQGNQASCTPPGQIF